MGKQIAVIGGGISGLAAANILQKNGHTVTIFEKSEKIGGVWAVAYPEVRLQNTWREYGMADFPWPFKPDLHPTAAQILRYMQEAIVALRLDVRLAHEVVAMHETDGGWQLDIRHAEGIEQQAFDYVVVASGQYTEGKYFPQLPDQARFKGQVLSERDVKDLEIFRGKRVVVVGFGKSALDMATFAAEHGAEVHHVFRQTRWILPKYVLGLHFTIPFFARVGSVMMTSWAHPTRPEQFLHKQLKFVVNGFWRIIEQVFWLQARVQFRGKGPEAQQRLAVLKPNHRLLPDLRSAVALAPDHYYRYVAEGKITPHHSPVLGFTEDGLLLSDEKIVPSDIVVLSLGSKTPSFPYLPDTYRELLERENDGVQLYRHLIHPRIPNLGFAGFNHGFLHIPSVEVGVVWLCALLDGYMHLPSVTQMEASIEHVRQWKRDHIHYEPSRSVAINTRYQQYLDILLKDLQLSPYRKGINLVAEVFMRYGSKDYRKVLSEYQALAQQNPHLAPIALDT